MPRIVLRLAVAALVAATVGLGAATPAQAATCTTSHGVTVVVDFHQLGGGVQTACDVSGAGRTAATQLTDVGHSLVYVQRQPGFVCRIDQAPSSDPCVNTPPTDAYWSLWWSDGKSGAWTYASTGVGGLKVPDGGYVAMSWQGGAAKAPPRVTPKSHPQASSSPTPRPSPHPSPHPSTSPTHPASSAPPDAPTSASSSASAAPAAGSSGGPTHRAHAHASTKPEPAPTRGAHSRSARADGPLGTGAAPASASTSASTTAGGGGLPGWLAPAAVVLLFAAAGTVVVVRRRGSGGA